MISNELTEKLINEIRDSTNLYKYINKYDMDFPQMTLNNYIDLVIQKKGLKKSDVVKKSCIYRTFAYQILSGKRKPSRDASILLAYALELSLEETQKFLKLSEHSPLSPKLKRDAIIIFSFINHISINDINDLLFENEEDLLR